MRPLAAGRGDPPRRGLVFGRREAPFFPEAARPALFRGATADFLRAFERFGRAAAFLAAFRALRRLEPRGVAALDEPRGAGVSDGNAARAGTRPVLHQTANASESGNMRAYADSENRLNARATTILGA